MSAHKTTGSSPAARRRKTGVLVHGYNLHAGRWEDVAWGAPPDRAGRVPVGVFTALYEQAEVLVFGSGASKKDGLLESEATARLLWDRFDELAGFDLFENRLDELKHPDTSARLKKRIEAILHLDTASRNTREEIVHAGRVFVEQDVERVILVSSPTHLPRCLRDACAIYGEDEGMSGLLQGLCAAPSVTGYPGYTAEDVAIFEPPHRPDRPGGTGGAGGTGGMGGAGGAGGTDGKGRRGPDVSEVVARVHHIPAGKRARFVRRLDDLLMEFDV